MTGSSLRGVLVCYRERLPPEWTYWDTPFQARQAKAELVPCGPHCIGVHTAVAVDPSRGSTRRRAT